MQEIKGLNPFFSTETSFGEMVDNSIKLVDVLCPCCGKPIRMTEAYISEYQSNQIDMCIFNFERLINDTQDAIMEIYGIDPRMEMLTKRMQSLRQKYDTPNFTVVKGGKHEPEV